MNNCARVRFIPRSFTLPKTIEANHLADSALPGTPRITVGLFIGSVCEIRMQRSRRLRVSLGIRSSAFISSVVPIKKLTLHLELVPCSP